MHRRIIVLIAVILAFAAQAHAQGGFRAVSSGDWSDSRNWEIRTGGIWLKPPEGVFPGESHNRNVDVVIDDSVTLTVGEGPAIEINSLAVLRGKLVVNGSMIIGPTSDDPNNRVKIIPSNGGIGIGAATTDVEPSAPVAPAPAQEAIPMQLLQNVPNPVSFATGDWTTVRFYIDRDYPLVRVEIYDQLGSMLKRVFEENDPAVGWRSMRINVRDLQSGSYPVVLQAGRQVLRRSLTVIR